MSVAIRSTGKLVADADEVVLTISARAESTLAEGTVVESAVVTYLSVRHLGLKAQVTDLANLLGTTEQREFEVKHVFDDRCACPFGASPMTPND